MASHNLSLRGRIVINDGVTLEQVWDALCDCAAAHDIELGVLPDSTTGCIEFVNDDNVVQLFDDHSLFVNLWLHGTGQGCWPEASEDMLRRLDSLCDKGGALELFDTEVSSMNDDASKSVRFVGSTEGAKRAARVRYGLEQAEDWLKPVLGLAGFDCVKKAALEELELANSREDKAH